MKGTLKLNRPQKQSETKPIAEEQKARARRYQKKNGKPMSQLIQNNKKLLKEIHAYLKEAYPSVFDRRHPKPLAIGTGKRIIKALDNLPPSERERWAFSKAQVRKFIHFWVTRESYLKAIENNTHRLDLNGEPAQDITEDQKQYCQAVREQKRAKHKLERQAKKTRKQHS